MKRMTKKKNRKREKERIIMKKIEWMNEDDGKGEMKETKWQILGKKY